MKPVISVVIAAYNEEKLLPKCLAALKNQDFDKPFEIILVDNCSTDKTTKIGKKFGCRVIHEAKKGQIFAKQRGCMEARGDIIAVLDADCIAHDEWLSIIHKEISGNNVVCVTGIYEFQENVPIWSRVVVKLLYYPLFVFFTKILHIPYVTGGDVAFRKKAFVSFNGYDLNCSLAETEFGIAKKLSRFGKMKYVPNMNIISDPRFFEYGILHFFFRFWGRDYIFSHIFSKIFKKPILTDSMDRR